MEKLVGIATDGASVMLGKHEGVVALIEKRLDGNLTVFSLQCHMIK